MNIKRHIPNSITCCNLISGCIATWFASTGQFRLALLWIIIGAVFDFFDGMTARLLHVSSPIGKELDSLADDITFGVAPSMMLFHELSIIDYPYALEATRTWLPFVAFVLAAFSALRLAKFNLDERQTTSFIGLPTPANALFWGALLIGAQSLIENFSYSLPCLLLLEAISCWLLVSEIPMFALKFKQWGWKGNEIRYGFIILAALLIAAFQITGIAITIAAYIVISVIKGERGKT